MKSPSKFIHSPYPTEKSLFLKRKEDVTQWFLNIPENQINQINFYLSLHNNDNIFVKKIRENTALHVAYNSYKFKNDGYYDYNFFDTINNYTTIFDTFNSHGNFLNTIIKSDPYSQIALEIPTWIISYMSLGNDNKLRNPSKIIQQDIDILKKCESMLWDRLHGYFNFILTEDEYDNKTYELYSMLETLENIKKDLINKKFEIIPKNNYYSINYTTKKDLKKILKHYTKEHNITRCSLDIKQLVDAI